MKGSFRTISRRNATIFVGRKCLKQNKRRRLNNFLGKVYFSRFTYRLWKESHFSASCVARELSRKICIICLSLFGVNDQIMDVEAMNLTACNLAQKLACLEDIEGNKFLVVCASAESVTDKRFLQWQFGGLCCS